MSPADEVHGLDPTNIFGAQSSAADAVSALEEVLKPAKALQKKTFSETGNMWGMLNSVPWCTADIMQPLLFYRFLQAEGVASSLLNNSGSVSNKLDGLIAQLEKVERQRLNQIGFESFALNYTREAFHDVFEVFDSLRIAAGPSSWGYAEAPLDGHKTTVGQSSAVKGKRPTDGTIAFLKGHRFFDAVIHVEFYVRQNGIYRHY